MSFQTIFICIIILSTTFDVNAFHLSLHALEWLNASNYCQSYCNSNLASIHSLTDHQKVLQLIDNNPYIYTRVWLGGNDIAKSDTWVWSDGSNFNYGSTKDNLGRIVQGTYPWRSDEPDYNDDDQGLALEVGSDFAATNTRAWIDRNIAANYHFLCNDCSGKIHKYAVLNEFVNHTVAHDRCQYIFGTSLASVHSTDDMIEAITACKEITGSNGCWIGLNDLKERRQYEWTDGTKWDWGKEFFKYPWFESEPGTTSGQNCIFMDPSNGDDPGEYLWDDYWCHRKTPRPLCNAPSEICNSNEWIIVRGNTNSWQWNTKPCNVIKTIEFESVAILGNKQYLNTDKVLKIDMMYSILYTSNKPNTNAGIALFIDQYTRSRHCNNYYYIGIHAKESRIFIGKYNRNIFTLIRSENIPTFSLETQYLLSIELKQGIEWNIYLNKQPMITQLIHDEFGNSNNLLSGYIGIKNAEVEMSIKYLYISGEVQYGNSYTRRCANPPTFNPTQPTANPTTSPTKYPSLPPTLNPSKYPTTYPTSSPTLNPSINPTISTPQPSDNPSISPTKYPTISPTKMPTISPSTNPTKFPTISPTKMPSKYPTTNPTGTPTNFPTLYPTYNPSVSPSVNPTTFPTLTPTNNPSNFPTLHPSYNPSINPSTNPSIFPTLTPTNNPSKFPTLYPSDNPSVHPSINPSIFPTLTPTYNPSVTPTNFPSITPTNNPSVTPTSYPSHNPSGNPSINPSHFPTLYPSVSPSKTPTNFPTNIPSANPSVSPTNNPSIPPTDKPTTFPSIPPTKKPTQSPTDVTTNYPSQDPTKSPTKNPTKSPTNNPTKLPTKIPTELPTKYPTKSPTKIPTELPTKYPTKSPTKSPTKDPTELPTKYPTKMPTKTPVNFIKRDIEELEAMENENSKDSSIVIASVVVTVTIGVGALIVVGFFIIKAKMKNKEKDSLPDINETDINETDVNETDVEC